MSAMAKSHSRNSGQRQRAFATRCAPGSAVATRAPAARLVMSAARHAPEQALRAENQDSDHDRVDDESADRRHVIFAGYVGDAEKQRRKERSGDRCRATDGDDDQKVDHEFERERRIDIEEGRAERPAETGKAGAHRECQRKYPAHIDAEAARDALIVNGGAQPAAEARLGQHELQADREQTAQNDHEQPVIADARPEKLQTAIERGRTVHDLLVGAHEIVDGGNRHEDQTEREQYLVEVALIVELDVERALEKRAEYRG